MRLARVIRLMVSITMFRKRISFMRLADEALWRSIADEEKKEEALLRVLLFKCRLVESLQSTCQDVGRRGHHWLYHRLRRRCRPQ